MTDFVSGERSPGLVFRGAKERGRGTKAPRSTNFGALIPFLPSEIAVFSLKKEDTMSKIFAFASLAWFLHKLFCSKGAPNSQFPHFASLVCLFGVATKLLKVL